MGMSIIFDNNGFDNDAIDEFIQFCIQSEHLICYGAGRYAALIITALKYRKIPIETCLITRKDNSNKYFMNDIPLQSIRDYDVDKNKKYSIILALQPIFQNDVIKEIQRKFIANVVVFRLSDKSVESISTYFRNIKRNECLLQPVKASNEILEGYSRHVQEILKQYEKVYIQYIDMLQIGNYVSWIYYCLKNDLHNSRIYYLFYPVVLNDRSDWQLKGANSYLLCKLRMEGMEVLSTANVDFWRYFIQHYQRYVISNDEFFRISWIKRFNQFAAKFTVLSMRKYVSFSVAEEYTAKRALRIMGIRKSFVCIAVRDSLYLMKEAGYQTDVAIRSAKYRNSDIFKCKLAIEQLAHNSLQAIRMGAVVGHQIEWQNMIDYAYAYRDEFMDVYLSANCRFFVCNPSGIQALPQLFSKPLVSINATILTTRNDMLLLSSRKRDLVIFKKYWWKREQRYLTFSEMLTREVSEQYHDIASAGAFAAYEKEEIVSIENTSEEINAVVQEMVARLDGTMKYTVEDEKLQQKYFDLIDTYPMQNNFPFMWRIGAKFLRDNQWLLD